jgi:O-antigen/teichoic acid export membrane protein
MNETRDQTALRMVLRFGALVFGASAIFLLALPVVFLELLGLEASLDQQWSMRMIAITLVALTGNMVVVSMYANDRGVRFASTFMQLSAFGLGVITLLIPAELTWFTILYAAIGFVFSAMYTFFLFRRA